jgi:PHD/YefM family antitoxin component YafN of YafNO toxin-antitoxin module
MKLSRDIESLTKFKRNTPTLLKQLKKTKEPMVLTIKGKASIVVQDAEAYEELLRIKDRVEMIAGVKRGLESMRKGKGRDAEEFFDELFKEFNIPNK